MKNFENSGILLKWYEELIEKEKEKDRLRNWYIDYKETVELILKKKKDIAGKENFLADDKNFIYHLLTLEKIASSGRPTIKDLELQKLIDFEDFRKKIEQLVLQPSQDNLEELISIARKSLDEIEPSRRIYNQYLKFNRICSASTLNVSTIVNNKDFERVEAFLIENKMVPKPQKAIKGWYSRNEYLVTCIRGVFRDLLESGETDPYWLNILLWEIYDKKISTDTENSQKNKQTTEDLSGTNNMSKHPLNQILYGPAGTGKTYHTINHALAILEGCDIEKKQTQDDRNNFKKYMKEGRIQFVTFHQSYGYEEFVEGIKVKENNGQISYSVESGIFKRICEDAQTEIEAKRNNVLAPIEESINNAIDKLISKAKTEEIIFYTKRGSEIKVSSNSTGTLFALTSNGKNIPLSLRHIRNYLKIQNEMIIDQKSYEWAIANSLRPEVQYSDTNKINPYILIIDEINRGNISKIFGELITLIEESKREGKDEALSVILPYSGEPFSVPSNLYIIGTMNSSDRSLTSLDLALRRRFEFIEMLPDPKVLKDITIGNISVKELLEIINKRIKALLDQDHCIGHANFIHLTSSSTVQDLMAVFEKKIIPLLQEYFFNDWEKINLVLGNNGMIVNDKIDENLFPSMDINQIERLNSRSWIVNKDLFKGKEDVQIKALQAIVSRQSKTSGDGA